MTKLKTSIPTGVLILVVLYAAQVLWSPKLGRKLNPNQRSVTLHFFALPHVDRGPPRYNIQGHVGRNDAAEVDVSQNEYADVFLVEVGDTIEVQGVARNGPFAMFRCDIRNAVTGADITRTRIRNMTGYPYGSYTACTAIIY